ncbi:tRNA (N6-isopentenyl adenosine(37)-C2)-methylthiotransferase MiaB [Patescibacteria group bacterium]|nr:tRNA (N6-isopentenyl adenosine(37)-C2)-methylthiotransferase MiaB [Patescibacteria group bacterium]MBU1953533.1 tRNA (N6-isopentenyl adenosine(37)-C2)-methylthiotransferase MiaB [Patescibacteria group bacterium]
MKYYIQTLGCAMNYSDSERVAALLEKMGYDRTSVAEETDLYIFNTCSIRQKGEDRVFGYLKNIIEWKKKNPRLLVGLTGCMVRRTSSKNSEKKDQDELIKKLKPLDFTFRITEAQKLGEVLEEVRPGLEIPELKEAGLSDYLRIRPKYTSSFQAYVPIQIGCDKYCTYCIVPYARGREKSRPMEEILAECKTLVENGCKEITLGGQNVNAYGKSVFDKQSGKFGQNEDPFITLLREVDKLKALGLKRLRFTSPHPRHFTDELIELHTQLETLVNHIHLPVQAGDDAILKKMNRQYTVDEYRRIWKKIKKVLPGGSFTTDIIVGFCGETEQQFEGTRRLYEEIEWDMAYLARYSPRRGTTSFAAWEDDVSREEKARRWHVLNEVLERCSIRYNESLIGKTLEVLVEKYNEETGECEGKSRENIVVQFPGNPDMIGELVESKITKALTWSVKGAEVGI